MRATIKLLSILTITCCLKWKLTEGSALGECSSPLHFVGIEASTVRGIQTADQATLYSEGWCADVTDTSQYIQVNLGKVKILTAIATRGHAIKSKWVKTYKIEYSFDGSDWFEYKERYNSDQQVLQGNTDNNTTVINNIEDLAAQYVRIKPQTWKDTLICLRFELLGCSADCKTWLGMTHTKETPDIPDSALSVSSVFNSDFLPPQARLFKENTVSPSGAGAWAPGYYHQNSNSYLQIDLGRVMVVSGMITMGRSYDNQWVTTFIVAHSLDNSHWYDVSPYFTGNSDGYSRDLKENHFDPPLHARYIRLRARYYYRYIAFRAELMGCKRAGQKELGMSTYKIPDSSVTASSYYSSSYYGYYARLGLKISNGAWACASSEKNVNQWLQIYLGDAPVPVTGVAVQGQSYYNEYITMFTLSFSNDTQNWKPYEENGKEKVFNYGTVRDLIERYHLDHFMLAKYIRFYAKSWYVFITMRAEVYGYTGEAPQIFKRSPGNITLGEYGGVTLHCGVIGDGDITVKWYKGTQLVQSSLARDRTDLAVGKPENAGYRCLVGNEHGEDSYSVRINIVKRNDSLLMICLGPEQLNDVTRSPENHIRVEEEDETIIRPDKWYIFDTGHGKEIPEACPPAGGCGAFSPGWLSGKTPTVEQGLVDAKICFRTTTSCCGASARVWVRRCYGYVAYKFYEGIPRGIGARVCVSNNVGSSPPAVPSILTVGRGYALTGYLDATYPDTVTLMRCTIFCVNSATCLSFNYSSDDNMCELSTTTKDQEPSAYVKRHGFRYYEKIAGRKSTSLTL